MEARAKSAHREEQRGREREGGAETEIERRGSGDNRRESGREQAKGGENREK